MIVDNANQPQANILLVEDNPAEVRLAREALTEVGQSVSLTVAQNGMDALATLREYNDGDNNSEPLIVLLDIHLPGENGGSVLSKIKSDPALKQTPVIVFTTSVENGDIRRMYDNHANAYISKPSDISEFIRTIDYLVSFWFTAATLPNQH